MNAVNDRVRIELLGRFRILVGGREAPPHGWPYRRAAELVQLLALAGGHHLLRDQVIDALWSRLDPDAGAANLRKAAHHARQILGDPDAVVLRGGRVALFPSHQVETDVDRFEHAARAALRQADPATCAEVAATYPGDLLPDELYEEWAQARREHLRSRYLELLRRGGEWERLVEVEPTEESAYRELMRAAVDTGNRHAAIRWYGRLRTVLEQELGVLPGHETEALYDKCVARLRPAEREIVGRQVELAQVAAVLRPGADSGPGALLLRGPAGMGKSALCGRIASMARAEAWAVTTVTATPESGPYAPLVAAIEQLLGRDRGMLDTVGDRTRSVLAELTMLAAPAPALDGSLTRHQVIGAVRRLLLAGGAAAGVMLIVDDAHLADDATTEALLHLVGAGGTRSLVVLAYRQEQARDVLSRGVARLDRAGATVAIDLRPLERDEAAALVAVGAPTALDAAIVAKIVDLGRGNPFFILELARNAVAGVPHAVSPTVWEAVTARFVDLDGGSAAMLRRLAVAGGDLDPTGILAVTGLPEAEAFALLDVALDADVLVVSGSRYRFRHELVRQALIEQVPPHRRIAVHRDTARRLAAAGGSPALIARHWLDGGRPDEATGWLVAAARHAVKLGAFADALEYLEIVLEHAPGHPDALCLRAEALEALGDGRLRRRRAAGQRARVARDPRQAGARPGPGGGSGRRPSRRWRVSNRRP